MTQLFYQNAEGQQCGPIDSKELRRLAGAGIIKPDTLIRQSGSTNWVQAERVQGLFNRNTPPPSSSMVRATLVHPPVPPAPLSAPLESVAPSRHVGGNMHTRDSWDEPAGNKETKQRRRIHPSTWVAAIASAGCVLLLLLLLAIAFRGGSQQAETTQLSSVVPDAAITPLAQRDPNEELSASELYERALPSALRIENYNRDGKLDASGSGFLVSPNGQVVTNLHVIRGADTLTVRLSSGTTIAVQSILCFNEAHDLAVLHIGGSGHNYLQISNAKPAVGTRVYAIGNPLGLTGTLSEGVVSGLPDLDGVLYVQTTAAISPGSSGGPLLAANGSVIGITTASLRGGQNLNLAVPASAISRMLNEKQQPLTLAQFNTRIGSENQQITTEDDAAKLAETWAAIKANKTGDALRVLASIPDTRRGTGYWIASGHLHFKLGNFESAQSAFGKAVANDPHNTESLLRLALAFRFDGSPGWKGHNEIATDLCKRVMQLEPTNVAAYVICGLCTQYDNWVESIGHFKTALAIDPADFGAHYNLGLEMMYRHQRNAWEPLQEALRLEKEINLDDYWVKTDETSSLTTLPTRSLEVPLKLAIAKAYKNGDQYDRAIQEYKAVLAIEPDNQVAPAGLFSTFSAWRGSDDSNTLHWKRRARGAGIVDEMSLETHMPVIVFNYYGMFR